MKLCILYYKNLKLDPKRPCWVDEVTRPTKISLFISLVFAHLKYIFSFLS